jgi:hypothetical protein
VDSSGPCLPSGHAHHPLQEGGVPGTGQGQGHREVRAARGDEAVERLLVGEGGDAEPRVLDEPLLHGVDEDRALPGSQGDSLGLLAELARPGQLADPMCQRGPGTFGVEPPIVAGDPILLSPEGERLSGLLLERHPRQQVGDAALHGHPGILVGGVFGGHGGE